MIRTKSLIAHCRKMSHATEDIKWGCNLVFSIGGKMFAVFDNDDHQGFSFKAADADFPRLIELPGVSPAPYLARHRWVMVEKDATLPMELLKELLTEAYQIVLEKLPKKTREKLT